MLLISCRVLHQWTTYHITSNTLYVYNNKWPCSKAIHDTYKIISDHVADDTYIIIIHNTYIIILFITDFFSNMCDLHVHFDHEIVFLLIFRELNKIIQWNLFWYTFTYIVYYILFINVDLTITKLYIQFYMSMNWLFTYFGFSNISVKLIIYNEKSTSRPLQTASSS